MRREVSFKSLSDATTRSATETATVATRPDDEVDVIYSNNGTSAYGSSGNTAPRSHGDQRSACPSDVTPIPDRRETTATTVDPISVTDYTAVHVLSVPETEDIPVS